MLDPVDSLDQDTHLLEDPGVSSGRPVLYLDLQGDRQLLHGIFLLTEAQSLDPLQAQLTSISLISGDTSSIIFMWLLLES